MKRLFSTIILSTIMMASVSSVDAAKKTSVPDLRPVPGKVLDHQGIVINPTPVSITRPYSGVYNISAGLDMSGVPADIKWYL